MLAVSGSAETLRGLIAAGVDLNAVDERGQTALHFASQHGNVDCVRALLVAGANIHQTTPDGYSALHFAIRNGRVECARALLAAGANVGQAMQYGLTALHLASHHGRVECVRALLEAGADVEQVTQEGWTALTFATALDVLQLLCAHGAQRAPLLASERLRSRLPAESLAWLLATARWTSPLHHLELLAPARVRELLRAGAELHASDGGADAPTPLRLARAALLQAGAGREGAQLVVDAALPWSRRTHELFPLVARRRAAELLAVGPLLARQPHLAGSGVAFIDVWSHVVMAHLVVR